ncbi:MAG: hypothetical protein ACM34K_03540 [Bacillota bacterium]
MKNPFSFVIVVLAALFLTGIRSEAQVTKIGRSVNYLSHFIASDYFSELRKSNTDLALIDTIYLRALQYNCGDHAEALLDLAFATVPFNKIPAVIPLIRLHVNIPLPAAKDSIFELKNKNLPGKFIFDSPIDAYGDKDKLAHFFGSAYLAYVSRIFDFTEIIGIFVEEFEAKFYVQSAVDPRDLFADYLGELFGKAIKKKGKILPSEVFVFYPLTYFRYRL